MGALPGNVVLPVKYASRQNGGNSRNAHLHPYESTIREPTAGPVATPSAVSEPHLATVVIVGLMTIYKKPPVNESAAAANPGAPAASPNAPAANPGTPGSNQKPQPGANPGR